MTAAGAAEVPLQPSRPAELTGDALDADVPYDRGWAWMCLAGTFTASVVVMGGLLRSFGVLFTEIQEQFDASAKAVAWILSLYSAITLGLGPAVPIIIAKLGLRPTIMLGGLLMSAGVLMSAFVNHVEYLYLTYSIIAGFGSCISYNPSIVTLSQYFKTRRSFAVGLATSGSSIGAFGIPSLLSAVLHHYSLYGSFFILAAFALHLCITGAVMRPLEYYRKKQQKKTNRNSLLLGRVDDGKFHDFNVVTDEKTCVQNVHRKTGKLCCPLLNVHPCGETTPGLHKQRKPHFDFAVLKNYLFLTYMVVIYLTFVGFSSMFTMINAHAVQLGYSKTQAALIMSVNGAADLLMRLLIGLFADLKVVRVDALVLGALSVSGVSIFLFTASKNYILMIVGSSIFGLSVGCITPLLSPLLVDTFGIESLQTTFSLTVFVVGAAQLTGGPVVGFLKDQTGSWYASFYLAGSANVLGGLILLLEMCLNLLKKKTNKKADKSHAQDTE